MANNKPIQLTEQDLHILVEDAVRLYLQENGMDEGGFSALWGAGKQALRKGYDNTTQKAQNLGNNIRNTWNAGRNFSMIQKYKQNIENSLSAIEKMDADLQAPIESLRQQLETTLGKYEGRLKTAQSRTFSTQNYGGQ